MLLVLLMMLGRKRVAAGRVFSCVVEFFIAHASQSKNTLQANVVELAKTFGSDFFKTTKCPKTDSLREARIQTKGFWFVV